MTMTSTGLTLQQLIKDRKGDRSYQRVSKDSGGKPTFQTLASLAEKPMKSFPSKETIEGLERGLGVPAREIILAAARSLNINVSGDADLVIAGAGRLPVASQALLYSMAHEMLNLQEGKYDPAETQQDWTQAEYRLAADRGDENIAHDQIADD